MIRTIVLVAFAFIITGCTGPQARDSTLAVAHLVALKDQYASANLIYQTHIGSVAQPRRAEIERAWAVVEMLHDRVQHGDLPARIEALALYELARPAWQKLRVEAVALIASGLISDQLQQMQLVEIDRRARRLDEAVQRLAESQQTTTGNLAGIIADLAPLVALLARTAL